MALHDNTRTVLDPSVPKHLRIAESFRERIGSGELTSGDKLKLPDELVLRLDFERTCVPAAT
jgi:DNA-binding GntR family transcriptional regulator